MCVKISSASQEHEYYSTKPAVRTACFVGTRVLICSQQSSSSAALPRIPSCKTRILNPALRAPP